MAQLTTEKPDRTYGVTPRNKDGSERYLLAVCARDLLKIRRGHIWRATVWDHITKQDVRLRSASCGIAGCYCDAVVVSTEDGTRLQAWKGAR